ncbi:MAG: hypothetical protein GTO45_30575 [Candidatus Aminicenantes bacterium]|nr:hypothetical protein [Candidatus Aminicenantes bacterium]NIM83138.1 hypothetical protein [Candidatus Aminicenantes bacterium]NIN22518.1 hypothetical protein [Candidatus Aminicenantes bacterium]NIN46286.1 hypothetical protein [Candidatus Aminicenantes bacterium]NIN89124.1 hypothetical protein [Candidatus Aminicenantes bacterium]
MDRSLQEVLNRARLHLQNKEFNEGLCILEGCPDEVPQIEFMRQQIEQAKIKEIDALLKDFENAFERKDWPGAFTLLRKAQNLDSRDSKVRAAEERLQMEYVSAEKDEEFSRKTQSAKTLLNRAGKTIEDIDTAVRLLEEVVSLEPANIEADSLLNEAQITRADFLKSIGQVATLEQAGEFEDALKEINDLIARGLTEYEGKNIYEVRGQLERKAQEFADQKAAKYLKKAEDELDGNPKLALKYIEIGLALPAIPKTRRDALNELKIKAEVTLEQFEKVENQVEEARELMNAQEYEQAIYILKGAQAKLPNFNEARTYLKLAEQSLKDKVLKEARVVIARVESGLSKENLQKSKEDLLTLIDRLNFTDEEVETLHSRTRELLEVINQQEQIETALEKAVEKANAALENNNLTEAQQEIESLDKELQERQEVRKIRAKLTRQQGIEEALNEAREAFENSQLETARDLIMELRRRARDNQDVDRLYKEIEAAIHYNKGIEAFNEGMINEARKALKRVIALETSHTEDAEEYLRKVHDLSDLDRKAKQAYRTARKQFESERFQDAYELLAEHEEAPSSVKEKILELRSKARKKWRSQLVKQINSCLKASAYDDILDLLDHLKEVRGAEDSGLINEAYKKYHTNQAEIAAERKTWAKACQYWQEAQKYDIADERIQEGLQEANKQKAFQDTAAAKDDHEVIRVLEGVIEIQASTLTDLDFKIEERLYQAYMRTEEFNRALSLSGKRINLDAKFSGKAKTINELCLKLSKSKEKFQRGAFKESLDILRKCRDKYLEYAGVLEELTQRRTRQIIDTLLEAARELEDNEENEVRIISKYRELLRFEPKHESREKYEHLKARFGLKIADTIQKAVLMRDDENVPEEDIEFLVKEINEMLTIANTDQKTRLKPHLENLRAKAQSVRILNKKLTQLEAFLAKARETGDFRDVDQQLNEIINIASHKNLKYKKIVKEIQDIKERRKKCVELADKIEQAFRSMDFAQIEGLYDDLKRLDKDDEFCIQHNRLRFEDTFSNQEIAFGELKEWARSRRKNLETLIAWFNDNNISTVDLEEREKQLRDIDESDIDCYEKLAGGIEMLAKEYRDRAKQFISPPDTAFSKPAEDILTDAEKRVNQLDKKARELEKEAQSILQDDARVRELVEEASDWINQGKYLQAEPLVDEGLKISPNHEILLFFKKLINEKL